MVNRASEYEEFILQVVSMFHFEVKKVYIDFSSDVGVVDDLLNEVSVALFGQSLVSV